jgi:hypothetical protein
VARAARAADTFVALRPNGAPREPEHMVEGVLFGSGRHLFLVPNRKPAKALFEHIVVAWNGSRESPAAWPRRFRICTRHRTVVVVDEEPPIERRCCKANRIQPTANGGDGLPEPMRWTIESCTSDSTQHRGSYSQRESSAQWEPRLPMHPFGAPSLHALNFLPSRQLRLLGSIRDSENAKKNGANENQPSMRQSACDRPNAWGPTAGQSRQLK